MIYHFKTTNHEKTNGHSHRKAYMGATFQNNGSRANEKANTKFRTEIQCCER